jgi:uncharacterized membrane protein
MNQTEVKSVPELKATVGSAYGYGWRVMKKYFLELFLLILLLAVASAPYGWTNALSDMHNPGFVLLRIFALAYIIFVFCPVQYGAKLLFLRAVRGEKVEFRDLRLAFENYLNVILAGLLTGAIIVFGFFLLIVPGIIFACRLAFVPYLVMDRGLDPVEAVKTSWHMTKGHAWTIFFIALLAIPIVIAGLICLFVGVFVAAMWISSATAALYFAVSKMYATPSEVQAETT